MIDQREGRNSTKFLPSSVGFWVRLGLIGLLDAAIVFSVPVLVTEKAWVILTGLILAGLLFNWAYLSPRAGASKWLAPGLVFMALFVVWPVIYTAYVSLTNWATGNVLTKEQVVEQLERQTIRAAGEGVALQLFVYRNGAGDLRFLVIDPQGNQYFGEPRQRVGEPVEDALEDPVALGVVDDGDGIPESIGDFQKLLLRDLFGIAGSLEQLVLDVPGGVAQVQTTSAARLVQGGQRYSFDADADTLYDAQSDVTCGVDVGNFVCPDGRRIDPGWREVIGLDNYLRIVENPRIRDPFVKVFIWNIVFAVLSVLLTFALGLALANALQDDRIRGRAWYRSMYIIPYSIPAFISAIVWRGLLNDRFGQVNRVLDFFGIDGIPWLLDGFWAKVGVLLVNLWLGFPYMFLITSGALQSIPTDLKEAARVDGASAFRVFRSITLPLLLVSTAPLLIGSFAFNFNNFVLIFLLTGGGPPVTGAEVPVGETDLLISFTFDLAVQSGRGNQFALASAIVVLIFVVVAAISAFSFRFTRRLEEIYGG